MNSTSQKSPNSVAADVAEATLRLIVTQPAPEGLEVRIKAKLCATPRSGSVLPWPKTPALGLNWMHGALARSAAAAAIVLVVVAGGWGVYSHVQPAASPKAMVMPHASAPGGFSSAGAMRTPNTLDGPVLSHSLTATPVASQGRRATAKAARRRASTLPASRHRKSAK